MSALLLLLILIVLIYVFIPGFITACFVYGGIALACLCGLMILIFGLVWAHNTFGERAFLRTLKYAGIGSVLSVMAIAVCYIFV